jgi:hypothetical protein
MVHGVVFYSFLVAREEGIDTIVDIGEFRPLLWSIIASKCIEKRSHDETNSKEYSQYSHIASSNKKYRHRNRYDNKKCSEIRLKKHQDNRDNNGGYERNESLLGIGKRVFISTTKRCHCEDDGELEKFCWLESKGKSWDIKPASSTVDFDTKNQDSNQ